MCSTMPFGGRPRHCPSIDADRERAGRFLILGSVSPDLMTRVSESLAGRLAIVELSPLSLGELPTKAAQDRLWLCGGYPEGGVLTPRRYPRWQHDYLRLLTGRDLPNWGLATRPQETERLRAQCKGIACSTVGRCKLGGIRRRADHHHAATVRRSLRTLFFEPNSASPATCPGCLPTSRNSSRHNGLK